MAKIIKMNNNIADKRESLQKKVIRQYMWMKAGDIIVKIFAFMFALFCIMALMGVSVHASQKSFEEVNQEMQQQAEKSKQKNQQQFEENKQKALQEFEAGQKKSQQQAEEYRKKMDETYGKSRRIANQDVTYASVMLFFALIFTAFSKINKFFRKRIVKKLKKQLDIYESGLTGEFNTVQSLARLSDDYTIISNPIITTNGSSNELDNLIVGSNGIFVVETKNHSEFIQGDVNNQNWKQDRMDGRGHEFYNPVKQVSQHGRRIEEFLRLNGFNFKVQKIVYFANTEVAISISGQTDVKIFCNRDLDSMLSNIESFKNNTTLSENDKAVIINAIIKNQKEQKFNI